ncbi:Transcriptional regulator, HxlR family [hydrothermal vent metagenome]|uniref:Transcriptional regulator, HxlR family n=1 Tax=hydrothermal vent metagenome TaxID=652676 RepID=A0A3B0TKG8_9ZZZZ
MLWYSIRLNEMEKQKAEKKPGCSEIIIPVRDTLYVINGKWKMPIIGSLMQGSKRFKELERSIPRITPRMLSKELRELEMNQLIVRKVYDTFPVTIEYEITEYGFSLKKVLEAMYEWGIEHRKRITGKK